MVESISGRSESDRTYESQPKRFKCALALAAEAKSGPLTITTGIPAGNSVGTTGTATVGISASVGASVATSAALNDPYFMASSDG